MAVCIGWNFWASLCIFLVQLPCNFPSLFISVQAFAVRYCCASVHVDDLDLRLFRLFILYLLSGRPFSTQSHERIMRSCANRIKLRVAQNCLAGAFRVMLFSSCSWLPKAVCRKQWNQRKIDSTNNCFPACGGTSLLRPAWGGASYSQNSCRGIWYRESREGASLKGASKLPHTKHLSISLRLGKLDKLTNWLWSMAS